MVKGKTGTGFEFSVDETLLQNYRFVKRLAHVAKNDYTEFFDLFTEILGESQEEALIQYLEEKNGQATTEQMAKEFADILKVMQESTPAKNS